MASAPIAVTTSAPRRSAAPNVGLQPEQTREASLARPRRVHPAGAMDPRLRDLLLGGAGPDVSAARPEGAGTPGSAARDHCPVRGDLGAARLRRVPPRQALPATAGRGAMRAVRLRPPR